MHLMAPLQLLDISMGGNPKVCKRASQYHTSYFASAHLKDSVSILPAWHWVQHPAEQSPDGPTLLCPGSFLPTLHFDLNASLDPEALTTRAYLLQDGVWPALGSVLTGARWMPVLTWNRVDMGIAYCTLMTPNVGLYHWHWRAQGWYLKLVS